MPAEPFIGTVIPWAPNFAPRGWAFCEGQILAVSQHGALFSILGVMYGGDGRTTFALPDLRGRYAMHAGTGPGLPPAPLAQRGGAEEVALSRDELAAHDHSVTEATLEVVATTDEGDQSTPSATNRLAAAKLSTGHDVNLYSSAAPNTTLGGLYASATLEATGGGGAHSNMQPYLTIRYIIALVGMFPSRA